MDSRGESALRWAVKGARRRSRSVCAHYDSGLASQRSAGSCGVVWNGSRGERAPRPQSKCLKDVRRTAA